MVEEISIVRVALMVVSLFAIAVIIKVRKDQRVGNSFFVIIVIFWSIAFITALRPEILDDIVIITGLFNKAQFLLILSVIIIMYLLTLQLIKNKNISYDFHRIVRNAATSNFRNEITRSINYRVNLIVLIAAKNESKTIGNVIEKIHSLGMSSYKIIVVNDGSTDDTGLIANEKGALVINHFSNLGIGGAIKTGYMASLIFKPEIVICIDADGQHDPKYIPEMISKIKNENADLVLASRFLTSDYKTSKIRSIGNKFYTNLVNKIGKISISDVTTGYRGIKFNKLESIFFIAETNWAIEYTIRAGRNGLQIKEIQAISTGRDFGKSQFHKIERFFVYNINAITQIFNAFFRAPKLIEIYDSVPKSL